MLNTHRSGGASLNNINKLTKQSVVAGSSSGGDGTVTPLPLIVTHLEVSNTYINVTATGSASSNLVARCLNYETGATTTVPLSATNSTATHTTYSANVNILGTVSVESIMDNGVVVYSNIDIDRLYNARDVQTHGDYMRTSDSDNMWRPMLPTVQYCGLPYDATTDGQLLVYGNSAGWELNVMFADGSSTDTPIPPVLVQNMFSTYALDAATFYNNSVQEALLVHVATGAGVNVASWFNPEHSSEIAPTGLMLQTPDSNNAFKMTLPAKINSNSLYEASYEAYDSNIISNATKVNIVTENLMVDIDMNSMYVENEVAMYAIHKDVNGDVIGAHFVNMAQMEEFSPFVTFTYGASGEYTPENGTHDIQLVIVQYPVEPGNDTPQNIWDSATWYRVLSGNCYSVVTYPAGNSNLLGSAMIGPTNGDYLEKLDKILLCSPGGTAYPVPIAYKSGYGQTANIQVNGNMVAYTLVPPYTRFVFNQLNQKIIIQQWPYDFGQIHLVNTNVSGSLVDLIIGTKTHQIWVSGASTTIVHVDQGVVNNVVQGTSMASNYHNLKFTLPGGTVTPKNISGEFEVYTGGTLRTIRYDIMMSRTTTTITPSAIVTCSYAAQRGASSVHLPTCELITSLSDPSLTLCLTFQDPIAIRHTKSDSAYPVSYSINSVSDTGISAIVIAESDDYMNRNAKTYYLCTDASNTNNIQTGSTTNPYTSYDKLIADHGNEQGVVVFVKNADALDLNITTALQNWTFSSMLATKDGGRSNINSLTLGTNVTGCYFVGLVVNNNLIDGSTAGNNYFRYCTVKGTTTVNGSGYTNVDSCSFMGNATISTGTCDMIDTWFENNSLLTISGINAICSLENCRNVTCLCNSQATLITRGSTYFIRNTANTFGLTVTSGAGCYLYDGMCITSTGEAAPINLPSANFGTLGKFVYNKTGSSVSGSMSNSGELYIDQINGIPSPPTGAGPYKLTVANGTFSWTT